MASGALELVRINHWLYGFSWCGAELEGCRAEVTPAFWLCHGDGDDTIAVAYHPDFEGPLDWSEAAPSFTLAVDRRLAIHPDGREVPFPKTPASAKLDVFRSGGRWWLHVVRRGKNQRHSIVAFNGELAQFDEPLEIAPATTSFCAIGRTLCSLRDGRVVVEQGGHELACVTLDLSEGTTVALAAGPTAFAAVENHSSGPVSFSRVFCFLLESTGLVVRSFVLVGSLPVELSVGPVHIVLRAGDDVLVAALSRLAAFPAGELPVAIAELARESPEWAGSIYSRATVTFVGPATGSVLFDLDGSRRRWAGPASTFKKGEPVWAVDADEFKITAALGVVGAQPFLPEKRVFSASSSHDVAESISASELAEKARQSAEALERARLDSPIEGGWRTSVEFRATVEGADGPHDGKRLRDPRKLALLHGLVESGGAIDLDIVKAVGGDAERLLELRPVLRFVDAGKKSRLNFTFEFWTKTKPSALEVRAYLGVAVKILDGGWGNNYEFDLPEELEDYVVHIDSTSGSALGPAKE